MSNNGNSQKFIARNRAPRVQIEYDVEVYGSEKKVELPFVMGVLADLSGKPVEPLPAVADRQFLDIDVDNFDERMKAVSPRVTTVKVGRRCATCCGSLRPMASPQCRQRSVR